MKNLGDACVKDGDCAPGQVCAPDKKVCSVPSGGDGTFTVSLAESALTLDPGMSAQAHFTLARINLPGTAVFSAVGLPSNVTMDPVSTETDTGVLNFHYAAGSTDAGDTAVSINVSLGGHQQTAMITITRTKNVTVHVSNYDLTPAAHSALNPVWVKLGAAWHQTSAAGEVVGAVPKENFEVIILKKDSDGTDTLYRGFQVRNLTSPSQSFVLPLDYFASNAAYTLTPGGCAAQGGTDRVVAFETDQHGFLSQGDADETSCALPLFNAGTVGGTFHRLTYDGSSFSYSKGEVADFNATAGGAGNGGATLGSAQTPTNITGTLTSSVEDASLLMDVFVASRPVFNGVAVRNDISWNAANNTVSYHGPLLPSGGITTQLLAIYSGFGASSGKSIELKAAAANTNIAINSPVLMVRPLQNATGVGENTKTEWAERPGYVFMSYIASNGFINHKGYQYFCYTSDHECDFPDLAMMPESADWAMPSMTNGKWYVFGASAIGGVEGYIGNNKAELGHAETRAEGRRWAEPAEREWFYTQLRTFNP